MTLTLEKPHVSRIPGKVEPEQIQDLVNLDYGLIGRTVSTRIEPNTSGKFRFWLSKRSAEERSIDIGSIVVAISDDQRELVFGAVNELNSYGEADSAVNDYAAHDDGEANEFKEGRPDVIVATCAVVRTLSGKTRPVTRSWCYYPTGLGIQFAFGIVTAQGKCVYHGAAVPVGLFENGDGTIAPVSIDENYLVGPEAAHLNVSGISGLASKTSTLQFCMKALLTKSARNIGVCVMNVKSKDLLYIDQLNTRLLNHEWSMKVYKQLEMPVEPFVGARFFAPAHSKKRGLTQSMRLLKTEPFRWDLNLIYRDLPSLFDKSNDDSSMEGAWYVIREEIERGNVKSYSEMIAYVDKLLTMGGLTDWPKGYPTATWRRLKSDLRRCTQQYRGLLAEDDAGVDIPWDELQRNSVYVVDIQMLSEGGQRLVFGRCIRAMTSLLENRVNDLDAIIVFVDELNKFAPKTEKSAIKSQLIEVTARGRSLGLVLFGAEQFASSVEKEIVENSSTFMFGRTESTEMAAPNYAGLTEEMKSKLRMLPQGQTLVKFPKFPQPIFVKFPFPSALPGDDFRLPEGESKPVESAVDAKSEPATADKSGAGVPAAPSTAHANHVMPAKRPSGKALPKIEHGSLLRRYQAGEYEVVWEELGQLGAYVRDEQYYDEAWAVARETMRRARHNVEMLVRRLDEMNYHFRAARVPEGEEPHKHGADIGLSALHGLLPGREAPRPAQRAPMDHLQDKSVFNPPTLKDAAQIAELEKHGIVLPLSLRAWMEEVGSIDLTGTHPNLCFMQGKSPHWGVVNITGSDGRKTCYGLSRQSITIGRSRTAGNDIVLTGDEQVSTNHARIEIDRENHVQIVDLDSTNGLSVGSSVVKGTKSLADGDVIVIGSTKLTFQQTGVDRPGRGASEGTYADPLVVFPTADWIMSAVQEILYANVDIEPSEMYISPYDTDKTSSAPNPQRESGYTITVPNAGADAMLIGERHKTLFVDYLRISFQWGGFPGWERYKVKPTDELAFLTEALVPL